MTSWEFIRSDAMKEYYQEWLTTEDDAWSLELLRLMRKEYEKYKETVC
jgi:hypothetical protein